MRDAVKTWVVLLVSVQLATASVNLEPVSASAVRPAAAAPQATMAASTTASEGTGAGQPGSARLVAGTASTCLVVGDGSARCWGYGSVGALGDGLFTATKVPLPVARLTDIAGAGAGSQSSCFLRANGHVACAGYNLDGELGNGSVGGQQAVPQDVVGISTAIQVTAGAYHACALLASGAVMCWGGNDSKQLGHAGAPNPSPTPVAVTGLAGAIAIAAGGYHTCALLGDGTVRCWGADSTFQLGNVTPDGSSSTATPVTVSGLANVKAITAGSASSCALLADGTARCWGSNYSGQLGNGAASLPGLASMTPQQVVNVSAAVGITAKASHACALLANGTARCWGENQNGQLGGPGSDTATPIVVNGLSSATEIATGNLHTCALKIGGSVACWGSNSFDQLGRVTVSASNNPVGAVAGNFAPGLVAVGGSHTCSLLVDRTVRCWGADNLGQLGNGPATTTNQVTPVTVSGLTGVTALSAGTQHSCAIVAGGAVRCWGDNSKGQLGTGPAGAVMSDVPVPVLGLSGAIAISAGGDHTCAVTVDGAAWCWGDNADGEVGLAPVGGVRTTPYQIPSFGTVAAISAGSGHTCAITADTGVWCWGNNGAHQLGDPDVAGSTATPIMVGKAASGNQLTGFIQVVARYAYSCALSAGGTVVCWGDNTWSQLGRGSAGGSSYIPMIVQNLGPSIGIGPSSNHGVHTCAVLPDQTAKCWGANDQGQSGTGSLSQYQLTASTTVAGLAGAVQVSVGFQDSCALLASGAVKCWGNNASDQLGSTAGSPDPTATTVTGFNAGQAALSVDAGANHACALVGTGTVRCWGSNGSGRLGDGTTTNRSKPVGVVGLGTVVAIAAGGAHTCALIIDGSIRCWGINTYGQLGDGSTTTRLKPTYPVSGITTAVAITAGTDHTCALLATGAVRCWGRNTSGQLGDGTRTNRPTPTTVRVNSSIIVTMAVAISAGGSHTCAVLASGLARCWGANASGQLGDGTTSTRPYATYVAGITAATAAPSRLKAISAGTAHTCGVLANGTAKCWGSNGSGRLGDGSTTTRLKPTFTVAGLTSVTSISAGLAHSCAVLVGGYGKCWGYDASGQLGNGGTTSAVNPVTVSGLSGASGISAGWSHTCAVLATGGLRCWGLNTSGQVGDGTTTRRLTPRAVYGF